jgi:hypothetical protein
MTMLYFDLVIMIYTYCNKNLKQLNECLKMNFKSFQMRSKEFGIEFFFNYNFQRIIYYNKKKMEEIILKDYMQNIYFGFDEI